MGSQPTAIVPAPTQTDPLSLRGPVGADSGAGADWTRGLVLLDDFEVLELVGRGGMGEVYLVRSLLTAERYAVKRARVKGSGHRLKFLGELQTWIDLPRHPNLMELRFARTVAEEMVLFTDYADGGSLADWIRLRRLTEIGDILRLLVQLSRGLAAAHRAGIVHQDVKPGNFLLTSAGDAKLTDFGIARARAVIESKGGLELASPAGLTPAYCSPEQQAHRLLGPPTDIWSLGLSILEIFTGGLTWRGGPEAPRALDACVRNGPGRPGLLPIPGGLVKVLRRCFAPDPGERWSNGDELLLALSALHEELLGAPPVPLEFEELPAAAAAAAPKPSQQLRPLEHLHRALKLAGRSVPESSAPEPTPTLSLRSQLIADLAVYEEARAILDALPDKNDPAVQRETAKLFEEKAWVHLLANDLPGASTAAARVVAAMDAILVRQRDPDVASEWLSACSLYGLMLSKLNRGDLVDELFQRVTRTIASAVQEEGWDHLTVHLPDLLMQQFAALYNARDLQRALQLCDRALEVVRYLSTPDPDKLSRLTLEERSRIEAVAEIFRHGLEVWQMHKAGVLDDLGRHREAEEILAPIVEDRERRLRNEAETPASLQELGLACYNRAMVLNNLADKEGALQLLNRAAGLYERLLNRQWPAGTDWDTVHGLVEARRERCGIASNMGSILADLGRFDEALELYRQAVTWCEELVLEEGRLEHGITLCRLYRNHAEVLASARRYTESGMLFDKSAAMLRRLAAQHPRRVAEEIASLHQARALRLSGQQGTESGADRERAITLFKAQVEGGRSELRPELADLYLRQAQEEAQRGDMGAAEAAVDRVLSAMEHQDLAVLPPKVAVTWAEALQRKGNLYARREQIKEALPYYTRAISLLRPLCKRNRERWTDLAHLYVNQGMALGRLEHFHETAVSFWRATSLLGPVYELGERGALPNLLRACLRGAFACFILELPSKGRAMLERAVVLAANAEANGAESLPEDIENNLQMARRKLYQMKEAEMESKGVDFGQLMARAMPGGSMNRAVQEFFFCFTWEAKKRACLHHQDELLDPMSLTMFVFMTEAAKKDGQEVPEEFREAVSLHIELLRLCREEGIERAFAHHEIAERLKAVGFLASNDSKGSDAEAPSRKPPTISGRVRLPTPNAAAKFVPVSAVGLGALGIYVLFAGITSGIVLVLAALWLMWIGLRRTKS